MRDPSPTTLWIRNGAVVSSAGVHHVDVVAARGRIEAVGAVRPAFEAYGEIDATGLWLLPGGVDVHTHLEMTVGPYRTADDVASGTRAALAGGTTTVIDFANPEPGESLSDAVSRWRGMFEGRSLVDHALHVTVCEPSAGHLEQVDGLAAAGVTSVKLFTTYRDRLMLSDEDIAAVLRRVAARGLVAVVHAEDDAFIALARREARAAGRASPVDHARTRPPRAEEAAVRRVIAMARDAGAALHLAHLSTAGAVEALAEARDAGGDVTGETCPQYLWLDEELLARRDGARFLCTPPLRTAPHRARLWRALARGTLDAVATDHCPFATADKDGHAEFADVPMGLPGVGLRLPLLLEGVARGWLTPERLAWVWAEGPAARFGLAPRKGSLVPGADADLVAVDPEAAWTVDAGDGGVPRSVANPYAGMEVRGAVRWVLRGGEVVMDDGAPVGNPPAGRFLARRPGRE